jgi:AcrR family transcriptional regulator
VEEPENTEDRKRSSNNTERAQRILDAAATLLVRFGYDKTTISDIAQEAGISKGAIYLHYNSREELFQALIMREIARYGRKFMEEIEADPEGGTLIGMYRHTLEQLPRYPVTQAVLARDKRVLGDMLRKLDPNIYLSSMNFRAEFIRRMQAAGLVRSDLNPQVAAYILSMISIGFVTIDEFIPKEHAPSLEDQVNTLSALLSSGLEVSGGNSEAGKQIYRDIIEAFSQRYDLPNDQTE